MSNIFGSRTFWLSLLTILVIVVGAFMPGFGFDVEHTAGLVVVVAAYLIAFALSPSDQLKPMLLSRKFWAAGIGVVMIFLDAFHIWSGQMDIGSLASLVVIICAYMLMLVKDPGNGWRGLIVSRKFWATVAPEQIIGLAVLLSGYIASAGLSTPPEPLPEPEIPEEEIDPIEQEAYAARIAGLVKAELPDQKE